MPEQHRDSLAGQSLQHVALMGEERGNHLQPGPSPGGRQTPQARQVPGSDLFGGRCPGQAARCQDSVGPGDVGRGTAGSRIGESKWMIGQLAVPWLDRKPGEALTRRLRCDLGEIGDGPAMGRRPYRFQEPDHRDVEPEPMAGSSNDGLRIEPPGRRRLEGRQLPKHFAIGRDQDEGHDPGRRWFHDGHANGSGLPGSVARSSDVR